MFLSGLAVRVFRNEFSCEFAVMVLLYPEVVHDLAGDGNQLLPLDVCGVVDAELTDPIQSR